ncbi:cytochrome d ubiquinol oxidase subunit II, partial [Streptomyces sp. NPDC001919]
MVEGPGRERRHEKARGALGPPEWGGSGTPGPRQPPCLRREGVRRQPSEKRVLINTIGPVWDGNEVWLLTAGGATFAAF